MNRAFIRALVVFLTCAGIIHAWNTTQHRLLISEEAMTHAEELLTTHATHPELYSIREAVTVVKYANSSQVVLDTWLTIYSHDECVWADISALLPYVSFLEYSINDVKVLIRTRWIVSEDIRVIEGAIEIKEDGEIFHLHRTAYKHKH